VCKYVYGDITQKTVIIPNNVDLSVQSTEAIH